MRVMRSWMMSPWPVAWLLAIATTGSGKSPRVPVKGRRGAPGNPSWLRIRAMSRLRSTPTTVPTCEVPSRPLMRTARNPWTTCALVTKSPLESNSHPVPRPSSVLPSASIVTVRLSRARAMSSRDGGGEGATTLTAGGSGGCCTASGTAVRLTVTRNAMTPTSTTPPALNSARSDCVEVVGRRWDTGRIVSHDAAPASARLRGGIEHSALHEARQGPGAMGRTILGRVVGLPEGQAEVIAQEDGVVPEAAGAAWRHEHAEALPAGCDRLGTRTTQRHDAHVANPAVIGGEPVDLSDERGEAVGVAGPLPQPARRAGARPSPQRIDLDAAVVGDGRERQRRGHDRRLGEGVLHVGVARFVEVAVPSRLGEADDTPGVGGEKAAELAQLALIVGGRTL